MVVFWRKINKLKLLEIVYSITRFVYYVAGFAGIVLIIYFALDLTKPIITINGGNIVDDTVNPGDVLRVKWEVTTHRRCYSETTRHLFGECGIAALRNYRGMFPGKLNLSETHNIRVRLPESVDAGVCYYHAEITFYCNPLSHLFPKTIVFPDLKFEVVKDENESSPVK